MSVVDPAGERIGTVSSLKMGDPEAATTMGNEPPAMGTPIVGPGAALAGVGGAWPVGEMEPDVPEPRRSQLLRLGYVKVDTGLLGKDRYVAADEIGEVTGDTVRLAPPHGESRPTPAATRAVAAHPSTPAQEWHDDSGSESWWPRAVLVPAGMVLAGGGIWAFRRWQQERNRPVNRLRRQARQLLQRVPERDAVLASVPDLDDRTSRLGGAALIGLAAGWLLREMTRPSTAEEQATDLSDSIADAAPAWNRRLMQVASEGMARRENLAAGRRPVFVVAVAAGLMLSLAVRRMLRGGGEAIYIGTPGVESALGRDRTRSGEIPPYLGQEQPHTP